MRYSQRYKSEMRSAQAALKRNSIISASPNSSIRYACHDREKLLGYIGGVDVAHESSARNESAAMIRQIPSQIISASFTGRICQPKWAVSINPNPIASMAMGQTTLILKNSPLPAPRPAGAIRSQPLPIYQCSLGTTRSRAWLCSPRRSGKSSHALDACAACERRFDCIPLCSRP